MATRKTRSNLPLWVMACASAAMGLAACGDAMGPNVETPVLSARASLQSCALDGVWGIKLVVPVRWSSNLGVQGGEGVLVQYAKSQRTQDGTTVVDTLQICGSVVPDYRSQRAFGNELYGIRFPDAMFDSGKLPTTQVRSQLSSMTPGATFEAERVAVQLGVDLPDASSAPWPARFDTLRTIDADGDGKPGVTVRPQNGGGYSLPPTSYSRSKRADAFYTAIRNVFEISGTIASCDRFIGDVHIPTLGKQAAINAHLLGCHKTDGSSCTTGDVRMLDNLQPVYSVRGQPSVVMQRLPDDATCAGVRALQF